MNTKKRSNRTYHNKTRRGGGEEQAVKRAPKGSGPKRKSRAKSSEDDEEAAEEEEEQHQLSKNFEKLLQVNDILNIKPPTDEKSLQLIRGLYPNSIKIYLNLNEQNFKAYLINKCLPSLRESVSKNGTFIESFNDQGTIVIPERKKLYTNLLRDINLDELLNSEQGGAIFKLYEYDTISGPEAKIEQRTVPTPQHRNRDIVTEPIMNPYYTFYLGGVKTYDQDYTLNMYLYPVVMAGKRKEVIEFVGDFGNRKRTETVYHGKAVYFWALSIGHTQRYSVPFAMFAPTPEDPLISLLKNLKAEPDGSSVNGFFVKDSKHCLYQPIFPAMDKKVLEYTEKTHNDFYSNMIDNISFEEMKKMRRYASTHYGGPNEPKGKMDGSFIKNVPISCKRVNNDKCFLGVQDLFPGKKLSEVVVEEIISEEPDAESNTAESPKTKEKRSSGLFSGIFGLFKGGTVDSATATAPPIAPPPDDSNDTPPPETPPHEPPTTDTSPAGADATDAAAAATDAAAADPYVSVTVTHNKNIKERMKFNETDIKTRIEEAAKVAAATLTRRHSMPAIASSMNAIASSMNATAPYRERRWSMGGGKRRRTRKKRRSLKKKRARKTRRSRRKR